MNHTKTNSRHLCTLKKEILYQKTSGKVYVRRQNGLSDGLKAEWSDFVRYGAQKAHALHPKEIQNLYPS